MAYNSVNSKSIDVGLWTLKNINKIRLGIKILLGIFTVVVYTFFIINLVNFIEGGLNMPALYENIFKNTNLNNIDQVLKNIAPGTLLVDNNNVGATPGYANKYYDFYALVKNENPNYYIDSIEYYFKYNDGNLETDVKKEYVNISSEKFLFVKGVEVPNGTVSSPTFEIKSINWKLVDRNVKKNDVIVSVPRNCFLMDTSKQVSIRNKEIVRDSDAESGMQITSLNFSIKNVSLYDLKAVNNKIVYYNSSDQVIGVFEKEVTQLRSGGEKDVNVLISKNIKDLYRVEIIPEINFCSEDSYIRGL